VYSWCHLGRVLAGLGDEDGAVAVWRRALDRVRAGTVPTPADSLPYIHLLQRPGRAGADFEPLLEEALGRFPGNCVLAWIHGRSLMAAGAFEEAVRILEGLASVDPEFFCDERFAYDKRIFRESAYDSLALCHLRLGLYAEGARYYGLAEACAPGQMQYTVKRRFAEARAG
jgi:tetratricopeptide (TPR) repeat protein